MSTPAQPIIRTHAGSRPRPRSTHGCIGDRRVAIEVARIRRIRGDRNGLLVEVGMSPSGQVIAIPGELVPPRIAHDLAMRYDDRVRHRGLFGLAMWRVRI